MTLLTHCCVVYNAGRQFSQLPLSQCVTCITFLFICCILKRRRNKTTCVWSVSCLNCDAFLSHFAQQLTFKRGFFTSSGLLPFACLSPRSFVLVFCVCLFVSTASFLFCIQKSCYVFLSAIFFLFFSLLLHSLSTVREREAVFFNVVSFGPFVCDPLFDLLLTCV